MQSVEDAIERPLAPRVACRTYQGSATWSVIGLSACFGSNCIGVRFICSRSTLSLCGRCLRFEAVEGKQALVWIPSLALLAAEQDLLKARLKELEFLRLSVINRKGLSKLRHKAIVSLRLLRERLQYFG